LSEYNLHYNYKDLFLAPRLALSPKKIWVFIFGNLCGYIAYWILSYLSLVFSGVQINDAITDYGLFPCLYGNSGPLISWLIYYSGICIWLFFVLISITAVSRITVKQLKGDNFFSANDALDYAMKKWKSVIFAPLSIIFIIFILFIIACIFAMIASLPLIGDLSLPLFYIFYFLGGIFTVYSFIVFMVSLFFSPVIIGAIEEDTIGTVFHSYQITFNQPWRIITYHALLIPQIIIFINIFSWFYSMSFSLINLIFGYFMGGRFENILGYAVSIVDTSWISSDTSMLNIILEKDLFRPLTMASDLIEFILSSLIKFFSLILMALPNFYFDSYTGSLTAIETISGILLSIPLILLTLSVISYGLSILSVGETLIFIIFKKIMDGDNILSLNNEEDINKYQVDEKVDFDRSSQNILSSTEEE
tara:strand:- start:8175 stop:9431 length:1257 start_codon:yes stop_codon:yes gene_type:complete